VLTNFCLSVASIYSCPSCIIPSFPQLPIVQSYLPFLSCPSCSLTFLSSAAHRAVLPSFPQLPIMHRTFLSSAAHHAVLPSFPQLPIMQSYLPFLGYPSVVPVMCSCVSVSPQEPQLSLQVVRTHLAFGSSFCLVIWICCPNPVCFGVDYRYG